MPVNEQERRAIVFLAKAKRDSLHGAGKWDAAGIDAAVLKVANLDLAEVTAAAMRGASDRTLETPAAIGMPGSSCWRERIAERTAPKNPTSGNACWNCGKAISATCCDSPARRPERGSTDGAQRARAALLGLIEGDQQ